MTDRVIVKGDIGNALHSLAPDHITATSNEVFDETQQQYQDDLNAKGVRVEAQDFTSEQQAQALANLGVNIADASDFNNPDATKRAKIATVGSVLDGMQDYWTISANYEDGGGYEGTLNNNVYFAESAGWHGFHIKNLHEGDVVEIKGIGGTSLRLWYACDGKKIKRLAEERVDASTPIRIIIQNGEDSVYGSFNAASYADGAYAVLITSVKSLSQNEADLQDKINSIQSYITPVFNDGGLQLDGDKVILTPVQLDTFEHVLIPVSEGQQYEICGSAGNTSLLLWAATIYDSTLDTNYYISRRSQNNNNTSKVPETITILPGEKFLVVNNKKEFLGGYLKRIDKNIQELIADNKEDIENNHSAILSNSVEIDKIKAIEGFEDGGVDFSNPNVSPSNHLVNIDTLQHIVINVKAGEKYSIRAKAGGTYARLWCTTTANQSSEYNKARVSDTGGESNDSTVEPYILTIEEGEVKLIVNNYKDNDIVAVVLLTDDNIQTKVKRNKEDIECLTENVNFKEISLCDGIIIDTSVTSLSAASSNQNCLCRAVTCREGDVFRIIGKGFSSGRLWATYNNSGQRVRVADENYDTGDNYLDVTIGADETIFVVNIRKASAIKGLLYYTPTGHDEKILYVATSDSSSEDKTNADYIIGTSGNLITDFLLIPGATVHFYGGTYTLSKPIYYLSDCKFIGHNTPVFSRTNSGAYVFVYSDLQDDISNVFFSGLKFTTNTDVAFTAGVSNIIFENTNFNERWTINSALITRTQETETVDLSVGEGKNFANLYQAYEYVRAIIKNSKLPIIHIYGHSVITELSTQLNFTYPAYFIGETDDATCEIRSNDNPPRFRIIDPNGTPNKSIFRNVRFLRTGEFDGYNNNCFGVESNYVRFYDCVFENQTSSPVPFDNANPADAHGTEINPHGDRRHGCSVDVSSFGDDCKTEFHNCKGIGSPYGFKNCRGWYCKNGTPRFYNCIGIGGGIGERGYGWVLHRQFHGILYDCIGYGSPYGYQLSNGIQAQANANGMLLHCIAYGGTGYQYISLGDPNYQKADPNDDTSWQWVGEPQGATYQKRTPVALTGQSHGFGFIFSADPILIDCVGYAGDGEASACLWTYNTAHPKIVGGYYGKEEKIAYFMFEKDESSNSMTIQLGNEDRNIYITDIYCADWSSNKPALNTTIVQVLVNGNVIAEKLYDFQELVIPVSVPVVASNAVVTWRFIDATTMEEITPADNVAKLTVRWKVDNRMYLAKIEDSSYPEIDNVTFDGNENSRGIHINNNNSDWLMSHCQVKSTENGLYATSEKYNVPVVDCVFTADLHGNIKSFKQTSILLSSTNIKI